MTPNIQKAKPFIKWVGGKGQLLSTFETLLPKDFSLIDNVTYIEPFVGGGAMLFYMLRTYPNIKRAIINDINPNLVKAYKTVKEKPEQLIKELTKIEEKYLSINEEEKRKEFYLNIRESFNEESLSDIVNTSYFIFLNKTCFNGLYRVNSKGKFNVPFGKYSNPTICDEETIRIDSELLQKVEIINCDFEQTEKYICGNTFVYFDPPYRPLNTTSSFNSYAKEEFNDNEQIRLKNYFDRLNPNCMMMLSNSDCSAINPENTFFDDLYKDYIIERVFASRAVNANSKKRGKIPELLIRNFQQTPQVIATHKQINITFSTSPHDKSTYRRPI